MNPPRGRSNPLERLGAYLDRVGQANRGITRVAAVAQLAGVALLAYCLPNLAASPLCWLGISTGAVVAVLLWASLTKRVHPRVAALGFGSWLLVQFAAGFVIPWDPAIGDAAITLGVFLGVILSFALFQLQATLRGAKVPPR